MSTNQNTPNNLRRPPLRPNPNAPRPRAPGVGPRPKPNINQNQQNQPNQQPNPQDMFASLTQAYNNMVNNLQFMNAVNIVNGIYQNASMQNANNMHQNPYMNPFMAQQMMQQQQNMQQNNNQAQQKEEQGLGVKDKQAFFDEFYDYLTSKMAKDGLVVKQNENNEPKVEEVKVEEKQAEPEIEETRYAVLEAEKQNLSLKDYLNQECAESDFDQFAFNGFEKIENVDVNCDFALANEDIEDKGAFINEEDFDVAALKDKLAEVDSARAQREIERTQREELEKAHQEELKDSQEAEQETINESEDNVENTDYEMTQKAQEKEQREILQIASELKELEESIDDVDNTQEETVVVNDDNEDDDLVYDNEETEDDDLNLGLVFNDEDAVANNEEAQSEENAEVVDRSDGFEDFEFEIPEEPEYIEAVDEDDEFKLDDVLEEDNKEEVSKSQDASDEETTEEVVEEKVEDVNESQDIEDNSNEDEQASAEEFNESDYSDIYVDESGESLSRNMVSKIALAEQDVQDIYNEIKNCLMSYKGIKSRYSSACESFRLSRKLMAKFVIIGRTIKLYLALDVDKYPNNIYHQKDESKKKAYIDVPFMVKIKSPLSIRKAKELIDIMMQENDISLNSRYKEKDYVHEITDEEE